MFALFLDLPAFLHQKTWNDVMLRMLVLRCMSMYGLRVLDAYYICIAQPKACIPLYPVVPGCQGYNPANQPSRTWALTAPPQVNSLSSFLQRVQFLLVCSRLSLLLFPSFKALLIRVPAEGYRVLFPDFRVQNSRLSNNIRPIRDPFFPE